PGDPLEDVFNRALVLLQERPALLSDRVDLLAIHRFGADETFILEPLERRVNRSRRRLVAAVGLLFKRLHYFISVHRALGDKFQDHVLHIPGLEPLPAPRPPRLPPVESPIGRIEPEPPAWSHGHLQIQRKILRRYFWRNILAIYRGNVNLAGFQPPSAIG